jgi:hypothetical protein
MEHISPQGRIFVFVTSQKDTRIGKIFPPHELLPDPFVMLQCPHHLHIKLTFTLWFTDKFPFDQMIFFLPPITCPQEQLNCLSKEAYWYFFKMLVFGSTDPEEHPKLTSIAMELALEMRWSFI